MKTVWKFPLMVTTRFSVEMPDGAKILCVGAQGDQPVMWALVDTAEPPVGRVFSVHGTGHEVEEGEKYVGTFEIIGGRFVGHLFEVKRGEP